MEDKELAQQVKDAMIDSLKYTGISEAQKQVIITNIEKLHTEGRLVRFAKRVFFPEDSVEDDSEGVAAELDRLDMQEFGKKLDLYYEFLKIIEKVYRDRGESDEEAFNKVRELDDRVLREELTLQDVFKWIYDNLLATNHGV